MQPLRFSDVSRSTTSRFVHRRASAYTQAPARRSVNGEGWPGRQETETGKAKDESCRILRKGTGGLDPLTEEVASDSFSGGVNPAFAECVDGVATAALKLARLQLVPDVEDILHNEPW